MCGIAAIVGSEPGREAAGRMVAALRHRGPDTDGVVVPASGQAVLGHTRLKILDLSQSAAQPMVGSQGRFTLIFNGEIYNYRELRTEMGGDFESDGDTAVLLTAWERWGERCLDRLIGMFAFAVWDDDERELVAVRDRFGVKPLYYHHELGGTLTIGSEISALHAAGVPSEHDEVAWATYLTYGLLDHTPRTFWKGISAVPPGHLLRWKGGNVSVERWYDVADASGTDFDQRGDDAVRDEYLGMLEESVALRFRSDVPVGVCLSGGLDSSLLLALVHRLQGPGSDVTAFTFATGDERFDELPWVHNLLRDTRHPLSVSYLSPDDVPALAEEIYRHGLEPYGGIPTLAYARLFERAAFEGATVLLDGQGMDEQWAGYDYYRLASTDQDVPIIQGTTTPTVRPDCLAPEFRALAEPFEPPAPFSDRLRNMQYRDIRHTKLPRALRFNDRSSMRASVELREPFLDHRLVELALRQPPERKLGGVAGGKRFLREQVAAALIAEQSTVEKRPVQTPQTSWLIGELSSWVGRELDRAVDHGWVSASAMDAWAQARSRSSTPDNSAFLWQWVTAGLATGAGIRGMLAGDDVSAPQYRWAQSTSTLAARRRARP